MSSQKSFHKNSTLLTTKQIKLPLKSFTNSYRIYSQPTRNPRFHSSTSNSQKHDYSHNCILQNIQINKLFQHSFLTIPYNLSRVQSAIKTVSRPNFNSYSIGLNKFKKTRKMSQGDGNHPLEKIFERTRRTLKRESKFEQKQSISKLYININKFKQKSNISMQLNQNQRELSSCAPWSKHLQMPETPCLEERNCQY